MAVQVLVGHQGGFTDSNVGWQEKMHNICICENTGLFQKLQAGTFFPSWCIPIGYVEMLRVILGDQSIPCSPGLDTGYLDSIKERFSRQPQQTQDNCGMCFWQTNGQLVCLLARLDLSEAHIPIIIAACYVLHNSCEATGERQPAGWRGKVNRLSAEFDQQDTRTIGRATCEGLLIKEALKSI